MTLKRSETSSVTPGRSGGYGRKRARHGSAPNSSSSVPVANVNIPTALPSLKGGPEVVGGLHSNKLALLRPPGRVPATPLDPRLGKRNPQELLRRLLAPLEPLAFLQENWARQAVVLQGPNSRVRLLVRDFLHDLDLPALLQDSPSSSIHAWLKSTESSTPQLESAMVDTEAALSLAKAGVSLYFRAPEELENILVPGLATALGTCMAGQHPGDGAPRGEIETFVSGRGHVTGWHTDFQHNFTFQLRGEKRWRFKHGPVAHNIRALTPHYRTMSTYEMQMKIHLMSDPSSPDYRPPDSFFADAEEVTLTPGAVLYHPAGIWHSVESLSDSNVSINVSLSTASWAELIGDGLRQLLWTNPLLRAPIVGHSGSPGLPGRAWAQAEMLLGEVRRHVAELTVQDLLPLAMFDMPRPLQRVNVATSRLGGATVVRPGDRFEFSQLAVMVELPQRPDINSGIENSSFPTVSSSSSGSDAESGDDGSYYGGTDEHVAIGAGARRLYALHVNFGNEDVASWMRVRLAVPAPLTGVMRWLRDQHLAVRHAAAAPVAPDVANVPASTKSGNNQRRGRCRTTGATVLRNTRDLSQTAPPSPASRFSAFAARELLVVAKGAGDARAPTCWNRVVRLLRVLCHFGYLRKSATKARTSAATIQCRPRAVGRTRRNGGALVGGRSLRHHTVPTRALASPHARQR